MRTTLIALAGLTLLYAATDVQAQRAAFRSANAASTRPAPALRMAVYEQLNRAQQCAEANDWACATSVIEALKAEDDLGSYERAQTANFEAFIAFQNNDTPAAIDAYERMLTEPDLPRRLETNTQYTLAQLYTSAERYDDALDRLDAWWPEDGPDNPGPYVLRSQIEYQREDNEAGLAAIDQALAVAEARGIEAEEGWYQLKNVFHYKLEDYDGVVAMLEQLIERWPRDDYFEQLAGVQNLLGRPDAGLAAVDAGLERTVEAGLDPDEDLYLMKVALLEKTGDSAAAARTLEEMIRLWPKREYYEKLTAIVAELGDNTRELQLREAAYASGWLDTSEQLVPLADGLLAAGRSDDARRVLDKGLEQGTIEREDLTAELIDLIDGDR